ncbi:MAG: hypothetical protein ACLFU1_08090 [Alphaproteobacteria bacterium]
MVDKSDFNRAFQEAFFGFKGDLQSVKDKDFTPKGTAVIFSGEVDGKKNARRAEAYIQKHGGTIIDNTQGGQYLGQYHRYKFFGDERALELYNDQNFADHIWDAGSGKLADSVKGEVRTFVVGAEGNRIARRTELPKILKNPEVTNINGVDRGRFLEFQEKKRAELKDMGATSRQAKRISHNEAYRAIALAEIRQDLKSARANNNEELRDDAHKRWGKLKEQWKGEQKVKEFVPREEMLKRAAQSKARYEERMRAKEEEQKKADQKKERTQEQTTENKEQKGVRIELFAGENTQAKKVLNAQTAKAEINAALENKGVGKINGTDKSRFEAIRDRAEQKAVEQGSSPDVAKGVALNKLYGVMARYEQMKDRARVYEKPTKKEADAHMHRANDLNDKIIETRKQNAALTGQSYTGLQPKSEEHKQAFVSHGSYALRSRAKLALVRADLENEGKYEDEKERIEKNIAKNKTIDLKPFEQERSQQNDQSEQYGMGHGVTLAHLDNAATQYAQHMAQAQKEGEQEQSNTKSFGGHELSM